MGGSSNSESILRQLGKKYSIKFKCLPLLNLKIISSRTDTFNLISMCNSNSKDGNYTTLSPNFSVWASHQWIILKSQSQIINQISKF